MEIKQDSKKMSHKVHDIKENLQVIASEILFTVSVNFICKSNTVAAQF